MQALTTAEPGFVLDRASVQPYAEEAVPISCDGVTLLGVTCRPARGAEERSRAVLVVVGGPQYRVGAHRQFVLLARHLAASGHSSLRFDCRGMGDSEGDARSFERIGDDLRAAADELCSRTGTRELVIWGLCDAASAALLYAHGDPRVAGLVLLNPWVRTEVGLERARVKHYYTGQVRDPAFWRRVLRGDVDVMRGVSGLATSVHRVLGRDPLRSGASTAAPDTRPLPDRMAEGFARFRGRSLFILSGADLTAQEFLDIAGTSAEWKRLMAAGSTTRRDLPDANHTFSRREWRDQVATWTAEWLRSW
jgi:exosortase A-associated hydrolase 1